MEAATLANELDPYPMVTVFPDEWSHEYPERWLEEFTPEQQTMLEPLDYPNPVGLHPNEARWRDLARKLKLGAGGPACVCEAGWLPCADGTFIECHVCGVREQ